MIKTLIAALNAGNDADAEQAAADLAAHGPEALSSLRDLFEKGDPDSRWWAVRAITVIDHPDVIPLLQEALQDPDVTVRQCAARGMADIPRPELLPQLITCLSAGDALLARLAGSALIALDADVVEPLLEVLENGGQLARVEAVRALAEIRDPRAVPAFFKAVKDGDSPLVEYWADEGLNNLGIGMTFFEP